VTANEDFLDAQLRRAIFLERYKGSLSKQLQQFLLDAEADLETRVRRNLDSFKHERGRERSKRLLALLAFIRAKRTEDYEALRVTLEAELRDLAVEEGGFQIRSAQNVIPIEVDFVTPSPQKLRAVVRTQEILGTDFRGLFKGALASDIDRMTRALRQGVAQGDSTPNIVTRILGTAGARGRDGVTGLSRRQVDAVVRTATNAIANAARDEVWAANADLLEGVQWVSTLDGRTSAICRARDGLVFPVGAGPRPPAHWRCRSVMVAVFDAEAVVPARPFVRDTRTRRRREIDFRAQAKAAAGAEGWKALSRTQRNARIRAVRTAWANENIGGAPEGSNYQTWLGRQPARFQDEVLGRSRGRLFRRGDLTLDRFVDRNTGREFTLRELRQREPEAWQKAGLQAA
jgi:SPP1 gp7 family putative phage head morphogenesis protein